MLDCLAVEAVDPVLERLAVELVETSSRLVCRDSVGTPARTAAVEPFAIGSSQPIDVWTLSVRNTIPLPS